MFIRISRIISLTVILVILIPGFAAAAADQLFDFNKEIAIEYAIVTLKEFNANNSLYADELKKYNLDEAIVSSYISTDCEGKEKKVVLVLFPKRTGEGYAIVYLILSKDGYFEIQSRGYTVESLEEVEWTIKSGDMWNCGI